MTQTPESTVPQATPEVPAIKAPDKTMRSARLAAALRENLKRRKVARVAPVRSGN